MTTWRRSSITIPYSSQNSWSVKSAAKCVILLEQAENCFTTWINFRFRNVKLNVFQTFQLEIL